MMDRKTLDKQKEQFVLTYKHHCPIEQNFTGDLNRLLYDTEGFLYDLKVNDLFKLKKLEALINSVDRIVWSDQTALCDTYEQAYNKVKRELLEALEEFRK